MNPLFKDGLKKWCYLRPTSKWICGPQINGKPCLHRPDSKGRCQASQHCIPHFDSKKGKWKCTRSHLLGGFCEIEPLNGVCHTVFNQCKPIMSRHHRRSQIVFGFSIVVLFSILFFATNTGYKNFITPGPLTSAHSAQANNCSYCHTKETENSRNWLGLAFTNTNTSLANTRCLQCHKIENAPHVAHNLEAESLKNITKNLAKKLKGSKTKKFNIFLATSNGSEKSSSQINCATCHKDHQGRHYDALKVKNALCQSCHISEFTTFKNDHPEISSVVYSRRTSINFDHYAHFEDYYTKKKTKQYANKQCQYCHQFDELSGKSLTVTFIKHCNACHKNDVTGEKFAEKSIPFFNLPAFDIDTLANHRITIGEWPSTLTDEELSPFMIFLLSTKPELKRLLQDILAGRVELMDLEGNTPQTLNDVSLLAREIKILLASLVNNNSIYWNNRIEKATLKPLPQNLQEALASFVPISQMRLALQRWLPNLNQEIKALARGASLNYRPVQNNVFQNEKSDSPPLPGYWTRKNFTLFYRPKGHEDPYLKNLIDATLVRLDSKQLFLKEIMGQLTDVHIPGQCIKCHSIDDTERGMRVNWKSKTSNFKKKSFTKFNHQPHITILSGKTCNHCHTINTKANYAASYENYNPSTYVSNFTALHKTTCAECHSQNKVGETCITCHNYHTEKFTSTFHLTQSKQ